MTLANGFKVTVLEEREDEDMKKNWEGFSNGLFRLEPGRCVYPVDYLIYANELFNFKFQSTDVVVMSWPKCGTTWMQEIVWTMRNSPDLDHLFHNTPINLRAPFLDTDMFLRSHMLPLPDPKSATSMAFSRLCPDKDPTDGVFLQMSEVLSEPRTLKTHLPFSHFAPSLLKTAKVIFIARHPKDVLVSYHHHVCLFKSMSYVGTFDQFVEYFLNDDLVYGAYWLHLKEAWEQRENPNLHFMFYEDLKSDIMSELEKLNKFLGTDLSGEQLEKVRHYTSFEEMKVRDNVFKETEETDRYIYTDYMEDNGGFFRKGESGDGKSKLTPEQDQRLDVWIEKNITPLGIHFKEM